MKLYFILVSDKILYTKTFTVGIICFMTEHFVWIRKLVCHKKSYWNLIWGGWGLNVLLDRGKQCRQSHSAPIEVPLRSCVQTFYPILPSSAYASCWRVSTANLCWQFSSLYFEIRWFSTLLSVLLTFSCSSYRL